MNVLVIEDLPHILDRIGNTLKNCQIEKFDHCDNAKRAREELKLKNYDLIITEVALKSISCLEVNQLAKEKNPKCCVIIITPLDNSDIAEKAVKNGAFDFIIRPAQMDKLDGLIKLYKMVN